MEKKTLFIYLILGSILFLLVYFLILFSYVSNSFKNFDEYPQCTYIRNNNITTDSVFYNSQQYNTNQLRIDCQIIQDGIRNRTK